MMPYNINIYSFARIEPIFGHVGWLDSANDICEDELSRRSNGSKLFHFKYKGRVVGMHLPLLSIEGVGGMDQRGSGRHRHPRTSHGGPPASRPAGRSSGGHNSLVLKCLNDFIAPLERGG